MLSLSAVLLFSPGCTDPDKAIEKKFAEAQEKLEEGRTEEGIALLEELHEDHPDRLDVVEFLAFTYASNNKPGKAADSFAKGAELAPERGDLLLFSAQAREEAGDLEEAATGYRMYIMDHFDDFSGWQALAQVEERRGHPREAIDAYLNVHRLRPAGSTAVSLGDLFLQVGNIAQAHHWYKAALDHEDEAVPDALLGLLRISLEEENWDQAHQLIDRLDTRHAGKIDESELAEVRTELKRWREAQEELKRVREEQEALARRRAAERETREEEERLALLKAREEEEQARLAAEAARAAEEAEDEPEPPAPEPAPEREDRSEEVLAQAKAARQSGNYRRAASLYWEALTYDDERAETWFELSRAQYRGGALHDAELTALEALRRDPKRENFHLHYLNVIKETQPVRTYLRELERIQELFPHNAELALALANTYARGDHAQSEAIRYYRLFLQLAPDDPRRPEIQQTLRRLSAR